MKKIIYMCIVGSLLATASFGKPSRLNDDSIDKIFVSFSKEKEEKKKKEEARKKKEEAIKKMMMQQGGISTPPVDLNGYGAPTVYSPNGEAVETKGYNNSQTSLPPQGQPIGGIIPALGKSFIKGVFCENRRCVAFTSDGVIKVGDKIGYKERVLRITPKKVKTNKRTIEL